MTNAPRARASPIRESCENVFAYERPHSIGSVCRFPCEQCGDDAEADSGELVGNFGELLPPTPVLIVREATVEEWIAGIRAAGNYEPVEPLIGDYYYLVSTD